MDSVAHDEHLEAICKARAEKNVQTAMLGSFVAGKFLQETKEQSTADYTFRGIRYKSVLDLCSGTIKRRRMTAIMGPSGAGKTTLLKAISGRKRLKEAVLSIDGVEVSADKIRRRSAFVYQENHLLSMLTVNEMLVYTIRLKIREEASPQALADSILEMLGLAHVKDTRIGNPSEGMHGISGGEMKRLSIALELVSMPQIIFLDEPTSGLDSAISESVIMYLRKLADSGMMVVMTIHQPSSEIFHSFDDLILLRKGNIVYDGEVGKCVKYLEAQGLPCQPYTNPADHLFRVIGALPTVSHNRNSSGLVGARGKDQEQGEEAAIQKGSRKGGLSQFFYETKILVCRNAVCGVRNKKYMLAKLFQSVLVAIVTGTFFYNIPSKDQDVQISNTLGCYWSVCLGMFGTFAYGAISILFSDRNIFLKEYSSSYYSFSAYYVAKVFVDFCTTCVYPLLCAPVVFYLSQIGSVRHMATCVLLGAVGHSLGLFVASMLDNSEIALSVFPGIIYPINMLTGAAVDTTTLPRSVSFIQYISPTRHAYNIMIKSSFSGESMDPKLNRILSSFCSVSASFAVLAAMYLVIITLSGVSFKRKISRIAV
jgi:ABC-type multidrug transport system ATPase subunit